jgi:alkylhydroperoxidase family enzyme
MGTIGFLDLPVVTPEAQRIFDEDIAEEGYVTNVSRLWAYNPGLVTGLFDLMRNAVSEQALSIHDQGILVAACASTRGDSYCSLAWGTKLAAVSDPETAAGVIRGGDEGLSDEGRALASWARKVAGDPNGTTEEDVDALRSAGFDDEGVFAVTAFVALRIAFSAVNDALGVGPDVALRATAPEAVMSAIQYGRPPVDPSN